MYQEPALAWLERQAEVIEDLVAERPQQRSAAAEVVVAPRRPLSRENKHGRTLTSSNASFMPLTLASGLVACRLLPVGCRLFAAYLPPA
jgi:hypothetical protein